MWSLIKNPNFWRSKFADVVLLGTTGTITGDVKIGVSPVSGAIVKLCPGGPQTTSKTDGTFRLNNVPKGSYRIIAYTASVQDSENIVVDTDSTTVVNFALVDSFTGCP